MKIIFLDIDGVLNSHAWYDHLRETNPQPGEWQKPQSQEEYEERRARYLDPVCIERLNRLIDRTAAKIVIISTWRDSSGVPDEIERIFKRVGFRHSLFGQTPDLCRDASFNSKIVLAQPRGVEVLSWIVDYSTKLSDPAVEPLGAFVILDDETHDDSFPAERFVRTRAEVGLTDADVERAIAILTAGDRASDIR